MTVEVLLPLAPKVLIKLSCTQVKGTPLIPLIPEFIPLAFRSSHIVHATLPWKER